MKAGREREATLLVVSADPARTFRRIAALRELAGYELRPAGRESLEDAYLDTPDGRLSARRIALRTRAVDGETLVTLKGPSTADPETGTSRPELELPAGPRSTARVLDELGRMGVRWEPPPRRPAAAGVAAALGLVEVQRRVTQRTVRAVVPEAGSRSPVAELALDRVSYRLAGREARLFEIEIEAKRRDGGRAVEALRRALLGRFAAELRPWGYSKLATGKAIERRARSGRFADWFGRGGRLRPSAIPRLARALGTAR